MKWEGEEEGVGERGDQRSCCGGLRRGTRRMRVSWRNRSEVKRLGETGGRTEEGSRCGILRCVDSASTYASVSVGALY